MIYLAISAAVIFLLDRWSKSAAQRIGCQSWGSLVQCSCIRGSRRVYRSSAVRRSLIFLWGFSCASAVLLHFSGLWFQSPFALLALGCALGGAAGNLVDILQHQYVVDFIDLRWWPVFNVADVGIVGGLLLAFWQH